MITEKELAERLHAVLETHGDSRSYKRLRVRIRELGPNATDEVEQFQELQKAAREDEALADDLRQAGFGDVARLKPFVDKETGLLINAFNRLVELHWER